MTQENITVQIVGLYKYPSFEELYKHFDKISMGYEKDEPANHKDMEQYYKKEEQEKYGVVAISLKVIENKK